MPASNYLTAGLLLLTLGAGCRKQQPGPPSASQPAVIKPDLGQQHTTFASAAQALKLLIKQHHPLVIGFGERHQTTESKQVASAISRFAGEMVTQLKGSASALLAETWVVSGRCGKSEKRATKQVQQDTKRPEATESELVRLLKRSKALGIQPHILQVGCKDYQRLISGKKQELDHAKLLGLVTRLLREKILALLKAGARSKPQRAVVVYGGALHNDLQPPEGLEHYTYAHEIRRATKGRYLEIDLYVPEYIDGDELLSQEPWYRSAMEQASTDHVVLIQRAQSSYILLLRKGVALPKRNTSEHVKP